MTSHTQALSDGACYYRWPYAMLQGSPWLVLYVNQCRYCKASPAVALCGTCYEVVYDGDIAGTHWGKEIIQVVERSTSSSSIQFDCFADTYANLTGVQSNAMVPIRYRLVDCTVTGPTASISFSASNAINVLVAGGHTAVRSVTMRYGTNRIGLTQHFGTAMWLSSGFTSVTNKTIAFDLVYADDKTYTLWCFLNAWPVPSGTLCNAL